MITSLPKVEGVGVLLAHNYDRRYKSAKIIMISKSYTVSLNSLRKNIAVDAMNYFLKSSPWLQKVIDKFKEVNPGRYQIPNMDTIRARTQTCSRWGHSTSSNMLKLSYEYHLPSVDKKKENEFVITLAVELCFCYLPSCLPRQLQLFPMRMSMYSLYVMSH